VQHKNIIVILFAWPYIEPYSTLIGAKMKTVIITGATGTLGSRILSYHAERGDIVYALSRCDHKIAQFKSKHGANVRWCLGDIRNDLHSVLPNKADIVYHCAALKHVDMGELYPSQYHDVNYLGTMNVFHHIDCGKFVFFSTDKAVLPINFYGMAKALAEKHLIAIKKATGRNIKIFRWGNIVGSQGSVIHSFINQIMSYDRIVKVTHPDMTRFWLKIDDAVQFATLDEHGSDDVLIHPLIKVAKITDFIEAIATCLSLPNMDETYKIEYIGIRPGEKIHEHLRSDHDSCICSDTAQQYTKSELIGLVGPTVSQYISKRV
jgi:UDP-N-acetylglucosamine 4,6-dehydratase